MKRLLAILLCGVLMMTMCACGSSDKSESSDNGEAAVSEEQAAENGAAEEAQAAKEKEQETVEAAAKTEVPPADEREAVRLASDQAVETAAREQDEDLIFEIDDAKILDENEDAWLVSIPVGEEVNGEVFADAVYIYRVDKKTGAVKFITGAQDYWEGMIDISRGVVTENAAETEYAE